MRLRGFLVILALPGLLASARQERYALVLKTPPAARELVKAGVSKNPVRAAIATAGGKAISAQQTLRSALEDHDIVVTGANHFLANVVFVQASSDRLEELRSLPDVAYVQKLVPIRMQTVKAGELLNVPGAWGQVNGEQNAGAGIRIGILDTGIDISHPAFQDNSLATPSGFPKCTGDDCAYTNKKVIAARSYVKMLAGTDPLFTRPDDLSPRDRVGHGTAVAMVAAGVRTTGPAGQAVGVAPKAYLGVYKVFGSPGVNGQYTYDDVLLQAVEDADRDGMDMIVMSLGTPAEWGPNDRGSVCQNEDNVPCDFRSDAIENAAQLGMLTITAAGNSGESATTAISSASVETPGTAPSAITVGATTNKHIWYQTLRVNGNNAPANLRSVNARFTDGPQPNPNLTAPAKVLSFLEPNDNPLGCKPIANGSLNGSIAVIERGSCDLIVKINNAQRAGAVGAIITQPKGSEGVSSIPGQEATGIPSVLVGYTSGQDLRTYIGQNSNTVVTLDPALREVNTSEFDTVATFSSRGPSIRFNAIKPEVLAVGTDLYMATQKYDPNGGMYSANGYIAADGTSFAAPMAAGVAAMIWQRNPSWKPSEVKSAIVNTADPRIREDYGNGFVTASVLDQGAGIVDANAALRANMTVTPSTLSFGILNGPTAVPAQTLNFCNRGSASATLTLAVRPLGTQSSLVTIAGNSPVNLPVGSCAGVNVSLTNNTAAPGIYEGYIAVTGGAVPLRVPYLYVVGDAAPFSILPLNGQGFVASPGESVKLLFKVTDKYGVPVANAPVSFQSTVGNGSISGADARTDGLGIAYALGILGQTIGAQEFYASVGNNRDFGVRFGGRARLQPVAETAGVVNAASGQLGRGIAPGSYLTIFGRGLSEVTSVYRTPYLPLAIGNVSVSFDVPSRNLSYPGRLSFVSDGQINVQVPWELQGSPSVQVKVSVGDSSTSVLSVPMLDYSPATFEYPEASSGKVLVAALDANFALLGTANPAKPGDVIQIYANGLGPVTNQPATGDPSPSQPLAETRVRPVITIGGRPAEVLFSGLAPQYAGLYQINVRLSVDTPSGSQPLVITSNGVASKGSTIVVR